MEKKLFVILATVLVIGSQKIISQNVMDNIDEKTKTEIFVTRKISDSSYLRTITTILGTALQEAEKYFGPRDKNYTILGVEICENCERPQMYLMAKEYLVIQITNKDIFYAVYQMAHEVVHSLSPGEPFSPSVLEEGLAMYFADLFIQKNGYYVYMINKEDYIKDSSYFEAEALVVDLLKIDKDIIKKVRGIQPVISKITPNDFWRVNPNISKELLEKLCQEFKR